MAWLASYFFHLTNSVVVYLLCFARVNEGVARAQEPLAKINLLNFQLGYSAKCVKTESWNINQKWESFWFGDSSLQRNVSLLRDSLEQALDNFHYYRRTNRITCSPNSCLTHTLYQWLWAQFTQFTHFTHSTQCTQFTRCTHCTHFTQRVHNLHNLHNLHILHHIELGIVL